MKYIIVVDNGVEFPILFHEAMDHKMVAGMRKVVSAGFVAISSHSSGEVTASIWGSSITMGLSARKEDAGMITRMIQYS